MSTSEAIDFEPDVVDGAHDGGLTGVKRDGHHLKGTYPIITSVVKLGVADQLEVVDANLHISLTHHSRVNPQLLVVTIVVDCVLELYSRRDMHVSKLEPCSSQVCLTVEVALDEGVEPLKLSDAVIHRGVRLLTCMFSVDKLLQR